MTILSKIIKSKYFYLYLLAALNLLVAYFYVGRPFHNYSDSYLYYDSLNYLRGSFKAEDLFAHGVSRNPLLGVLRAPFMLYLTLFFNYFIGSFSRSMMAINIIFYCLIIYVFYRLVFKIYKDHITAAFSSILFFSNYIMFSYGTAFLIDMGGWFFFILSSFFAVAYFSDNSQRKYYFLSILASIVGVFFKETGALGLPTLAILILFSDFSWRRKIKEILLAGVLFLIVLLPYQYWFYLKFGYSYLDHYTSNYDAGLQSGVQFLIIHLFKVLAWLYSIGWLIFIFGLWQEKKFFDIQRGRILLAMLPASLTFILWANLVQRVAFVFVPWLAIISGFGLSKVKNKFLIIGILALYLLANYLIAHRVA